MFPQVFEKVTGSIDKSQPGILSDYACYALKNRSYPGIVYKKNAETKGMVYFDLDATKIKKLDFFEGDLYHRKKVSILLSDKNILSKAFVYILKPEAEYLLTSHQWSRDSFETKYLQQFLVSDPGFADKAEGATRYLPDDDKNQD